MDVQQPGPAAAAAAGDWEGHCSGLATGLATAASSQQRLRLQVAPLQAAVAAVAAARQAHELQLQLQQQATGGACDPPEEFLNPITAVVMGDPVRLPDSGVVLDRGTVRRHLLSSRTDPFTRTELQLAAVAPDVQLRGRIEAWRAGR
jgi:hypothetical protein